METSTKDKDVYLSLEVEIKFQRWI